jgi:hypothetical protein
MTDLTESITLLDRTQFNRTPSADLPASITGTTTGDLLPWRISIIIEHSTLSGRVTNAILKLRVDIDNRFVRAAPILIDEFAKNKYLIEYIGMQKINDVDVQGKRFIFQISHVSIDIDKFNGKIITLSLIEQWARTKDALTSIPHYFTTPQESIIKRTQEFNDSQGAGIDVLIKDTTQVNVPNVENLKQNYLPQAPTPVHDLIDEVLVRLGDPNVTGGDFKDYYKDFEPSINGSIVEQRGLKIIAEEFGAQSSGIILDPKNFEPIDTTSEQTNITDNKTFKNHVILRCSARDGTLPMEHARYSSNFLHAAGTRSTFQGRPEWDGLNHQYFKGNQVKRTFVASTGRTIVRYFKALVNHTSSISLPPELAIAFWEEDFTTIPAWSSTGRYFAGDIVYHVVGSEIRYYECISDKLDVTAKTVISPPTPNNDSAHWFALAPSIPNRSTVNFVGWNPLSPWTESIDAWTSNISGSNNVPTDSGNGVGSLINYLGYAVDYNITRDTYEAEDPTKIWDAVNFKMCYFVGVNDPTSTAVPSLPDINNPNATPSGIPVKERYHGMRVLVGTSPTGAFAGQANKVATLDLSGGVNNPVWRFSKSPSTNDMVTDLRNARILRWNGTKWETAWDMRLENPFPINTFKSRDKPTPFHLVGNIMRTKGATGIPASAIEWRYKWSGLFNTYDFQNTNNNCNGVWANIWFPLPRTNNVGRLYGGNAGDNSDGLKNELGFCTLDTINYTLNRKGKKTGWNNGLDSEDLGRITGVSFKIKVGFFNAAYHDYNILDPREFDASATTTTVTGFATIPMTFWAVDIFDRIWFYRFNLRANNQWESVTIPFGELAPQNLHKARYDELVKILGYPIPFFSPGLQEKEYTGVAFDWKFVRGCGWFYNDSYNQQYGYYDKGLKDPFTNFWKTAIQILNDLGIPTGNQIIYSASIAIDEFRFNKELIVNSDDEVVNDPRTKLENRLLEFDYFNAKKIANGLKKRFSFFPQTWHIRTHGDVRMRVGKKFIIRGETVPNGEVEMVCAGVKHIINHEGYFMEVVGQRKFQTDGA